MKQLYSQNQIADILGISRGTLSKWLKSNTVSPKQLKGQRKYYDETVIEQYKKSKKVDNTRDKVSKNDLLFQNTVSEKQEEIDELKQLLKKKEEQLQVKDKQLMRQNNELVEFGKKFAQLADQAQQLNLVDKPLKQERLTINESDTAKTSFDDKGLVFEHKNWWRRFFNK